MSSKADRTKGRSKSLKLLNDRHIGAQEVGQAGFWEWKIESGDLFWSDHVYYIFALDQRKFKPNYSRFIELVHEEDRELVVSAISNSIRSKNKYEVTHRIITADKQIKTVIETGLVEYDGKGNPVRMTGTVRDITEEKTTEAGNNIYELALLSSDCAIFITDITGRILFANKSAAAYWEYDTEEMLLSERPYLDKLWDNNTAERLKKIIDLKYHFNGNAVPLVGVTKNNNLIRTDFKISPIYTPEKTLKGIIGIFTNVTDQYKIELLHKEMEKKHELFTATDAVRYIVDLRKKKLFGGELQYISPGVANITGINAEDFLNNKSLGLNLIHPEDYETVHSTTFKCILEKIPVTRLYRLKNKDGQYRWFEDKIVPDIDEDGQVMAYFGSARDVTERIHNERKLVESDSRSRAYSAVDVVVYGFNLDENKRLHPTPFLLSDKSQEIFGFTVEEISEDPNLWLSLIHPSDRKLHQTICRAAIEQRKIIRRNYRLFHRTLNSYRWFEETLSPYVNPEGTVALVYGSARDVTEQTEKNEKLIRNENRLRTIVENALVGILSYKIEDGKALEVNGTACKFFGYQSKDEFTEHFNVCEHLPEEQHEQSLHSRLCSLGSISNERVKLKKKNGDYFWGNMNAYINPVNKTVECMVLDVTRFVQQEDALLKSLKEKESLLQELHHRVKNNLQIINSLIQLQTHRIVDQSAKEKMIDIKERIQVIAGIHETLYMGQDFSNVDFGKLLRKILNNVIQLYREVPVEVIFSESQFQTHLETAIPLGLLVYEILSNSFKHAFTAQGHNILAMKVTSINEKTISIEIADNGKGYTENEIAKDSMGLKIINNLIRQLKGSAETLSVPGRGTTIRLLLQI